MAPQVKLRLYKTIVRPILEYPPIPLNTISNTNMLKIQRVQNKALKFITNTRWYDFRKMESLHHELNIEPMNSRISKLAQKVWNSAESMGGPMYDSLEWNNQQRENRSFTLSGF